jgi:hypothetical protein
MGPTLLAPASATRCAPRRAIGARVLDNRLHDALDELASAPTRNTLRGTSTRVAPCCRAFSRDALTNVASTSESSQPRWLLGCVRASV